MYIHLLYRKGRSLPTHCLNGRAVPDPLIDPRKGLAVLRRFNRFTRRILPEVLRGGIRVIWLSCRSTAAPFVLVPELSGSALSKANDLQPNSRPCVKSRDKSVCSQMGVRQLCA